MKKIDEVIQAPVAQPITDELAKKQQEFINKILSLQEEYGLELISVNVPQIQIRLKQDVKK
jgi:hypothetical protein